MGCRIHTASLQRGKTPQTSVLYMTLNNLIEAPITLRLLGMQNTPSLPSPQNLFWPGVVTPDRVLSIGL